MEKEIIMAPSADGGLLGGGGIGALLIGALLFGGGALGGFGNRNTMPAADAAATSVVLNPAFQSLQQQITNLSSTLNTGDIQDSIGRIGAQVGQVSSELAAANFTTLSSINGLGRDITASQNQNALQQLNSFNNLSTTTLQGFNNLQFQNAQGVNQIIAQGTANAAAVATGFCNISKEMAECCCAIKGQIAADGNATRALINDLNVQNLRDQLAAANNQISNYSQNQYLVNTIVSHLHPATSVVA